jgi:hypothetical protein
VARTQSVVGRVRTAMCFSLGPNFADLVMRTTDPIVGGRSCSAHPSCPARLGPFRRPEADRGRLLPPSPSSGTCAVP